MQKTRTRVTFAWVTSRVNLLLIHFLALSSSLPNFFPPAEGMAKTIQNKALKYSVSSLNEGYLYLTEAI